MAVWKYDTLAEEWKNTCELEDQRRHHSLAFDNDHFYIIGGFGRHRVILDKLDCFNEETNSIDACTSLPNPIFSMASFCHEGKLYTLKNQFNSLVYDPEVETWKEAFSHIKFPGMSLIVISTFIRTIRKMVRVNNLFFFKCDF